LAPDHSLFLLILTHPLPLTPYQIMAQYTKIPILCWLLLTLLLLACGDSASAPDTPPSEDSLATAPIVPEGAQSPAVTTGAVRLLRDSLGLLSGKKVGVVANQTSLVGGVHLIDTLLAQGISVVRAFAPEHGFRGDADAGQRVRDLNDPKTGLPIISLYGDNKKPQARYLQDLDLVIFDIQDVGARFYTYLSTLAYVMEACAEAGVPVLLLDRPNPNGWYVDGPVLTAGNESFIGMHQIPIVHGMTLGEYAGMVNGEGWLKGGIQAELRVLTCLGYRHTMRWEATGLDWVAPSPNLATAYAAYLYPALCWFEPTPVSLGRGTDSAFTLMGAPWFQASGAETDTWSAHGLQARRMTFTPRSLPGKASSPKYRDQACQGLMFTNQVAGKALFLAGLTLLRDSYEQFEAYSGGEPFFYKGFNRWPGNSQLRQQIIQGEDPEQIWESWQKGVQVFNAKRKPYLRYP
jgi:uncharacterized protein YbbC (DUF1343 family)